MPYTIEKGADGFYNRDKMDERVENGQTNINLKGKRGRMKSKYRILIAIMLAIAAFAALIFNLSAQKEILYLASIAAVCGTILILIKEIAHVKNEN